MLPMSVSLCVYNLFVCLSDTFLHRTQTAEDIDTFFAYDSPVSLSIGQRLPPQLLPQSDPPSVDLSVEDIRWQIAAK